MKLLLIYCSKFAYNPTIHSLRDFPEAKEGAEYSDALIAFIHAEVHDEENPKGIETKLVKNLKWAAKKNNTKKIILHSFAHLAETKADPHFTKDIFNKAEARMKNADYDCYQTPFGHFLDLDIQAPGVSQARVFKEF